MGKVKMEPLEMAGKDREWLKYSSILLSRVRFMGDVILTTPLIRAVRKANPLCYLGYLTESPYADLLCHNHHLNKVLVYDRLGFKKLKLIPQARAELAFIGQLRQEGFHVAIDLFGIPHTAFLMWASGAKIRVGLDKRGRRPFYTHPVPDDRRPMDAIEFHLRSLDLLGIPRAGKKTEVFTTHQEDEWARGFLRAHGFNLDYPIVGVHPGATWPAKIWFADRFVEFINRLCQETEAQVLLTSAPGDEARSQAIGARCNSGVVVSEVLNLRSLAAVLKQLTVFVSNDCGPLHLAVATDTPTIGIFGPGEPEIWFPYDPADGHRFIHKQIDCSRCHKDLCERMDCMRAIQAEDVLRVTLELLETVRPKSKPRNG